MAGWEGGAPHTLFLQACVPRVRLAAVQSDHPPLPTADVPSLAPCKKKPAWAHIPPPTPHHVLGGRYAQNGIRPISSLLIMLLEDSNRAKPGKNNLESRHNQNVTRRPGVPAWRGGGGQEFLLWAPLAHLGSPPRSCGVAHFVAQLEYYVVLHVFFFAHLSGLCVGRARFSRQVSLG